MELGVRKRYVELGIRKRYMELGGMEALCEVLGKEGLGGRTEPLRGGTDRFRNSNSKIFFNHGEGMTRTENIKISSFWTVSESQILKFSSTMVKV